MWRECTVNNRYLVSRYGEIKNKTTGHILKQKLDKSNCLMVNLSFGNRNKQKYFMVHRLVALAFLPNPDNLEWVRHKDKNSLNNKVDNLEWATSRWKTQSRGEYSNNAKMTKEQVQWCRDVYKPKDKEYGCSALAKLFNVSNSTMSYILNGRTYKTGG